MVYGFTDILYIYMSEYAYIYNIIYIYMYIYMYILAYISPTDLVAPPKGKTTMENHGKPDMS